MTSTHITPQKERVILALMTYGPGPAAGARILKLDEFKSHLDYFQQRVYNEVDTARMYANGQQEAWTAKAGWKSLIRSVPFEETMREVNELYKEGKSKTLGLSNYSAWEVAEIYNVAKERGWVLPRIYQAMYNCFTREIESELIPCLRKFGMELVTYNPLCGGLFSGKVKSSDLETPPTEGRFSDSHQWGQLYRDSNLNKSNMEALRIVEEATKKHDLTMLETALRWTIHHSALHTRVKGGNDGVVVGVSNFQQLEGNLRDFEKGPLPQGVVQALERAWLITKAIAPSYWR
ncbi:hypothetical protein E8E11_003127 [Didymella keratinophila]|nr:hypothetical protein E8E11_003127 [Didymella keratinophila]